MSDVTLTMWTIYDHPLDHPDNWVVRPWVIAPGVPPEPSSEVYLADTLEEARGLVPPDKVRLNVPDPDPHIAETWV